MRDIPLPPELRHYNDLKYLKYQGNDEWSAECVNCGMSGHDPYTGDPDRMRLFGKSNRPGVNPRIWCRACGHFAWADEESEDYSSPSPDAVERARKERERLAQIELEKTKAKLRAIQSSPMWKEWHEQMEQEQRQIWEGRGVCEYMQDYYSLGYRTDYTYYYDGEEWHTPALTIPHFKGGWELANIQFRLQDVEPGVGKYRQTKGLPAAMFRTEPEERLTGAVLVLEGAIKSMVVYQNLGRKPLGFPMNIVGIPSKTPSARMIAQLKDCEPVYLGLDPDAYDGSAQSVGAKLGSERVRYVQFPEKPDDLITMYGLKSSNLVKYIKNATVTA